MQRSREVYIWAMADLEFCCAWRSISLEIMHLGTGYMKRKMKSVIAQKKKI